VWQLCIGWNPWNATVSAYITKKLLFNCRRFGMIQRARTSTGQIPIYTTPALLCLSSLRFLPRVLMTSYIQLKCRWKQQYEVEGRSHWKSHVCWEAFRSRLFGMSMHLYVSYVLHLCYAEIFKCSCSFSPKTALIPFAFSNNKHQDVILVCLRRTVTLLFIWVRIGTSGGLL